MKKLISIILTVILLSSLFTVAVVAATEWKTGNIANHGSSCGYTTVYLTGNKTGKIKVYAYSAAGNQVTSSRTLHITVTNAGGKTITTYQTAKNGQTISLSNSYDTYKIYIRKSFAETYNPTKNKKKIITSWGIKTTSNTTFNYNNSYAKKKQDEITKSSNKNTGSVSSTASNKPKLYEGTAYCISPRHTGTNYVIDTRGGNSAKYEGANAWLWNYGNSKNNSRRYKAYHVGNGYYKIVNVNSGLVLDVNMNNLNVAHYKYHGGANQLWRFDNAGDGYVYVISKWSKDGKIYCLDIHGAQGNNGANLEVCDINYGNNQRFKFWN